jgi:ribosomal protein S18 acetylase RimI-like enzyme
MSGQMQGSVEIRKLGARDLALLHSVPPGLFDAPVDPEQAEAFLADPMNLMFLAFVDETAVAMTSATVLRHPDKAPQLFINEVATRPEYRGRGIAKALCRRAIMTARSLGCQSIWLGTEADNTEARALYRSLGGKESSNLVLFEWTDLT